MYKASPTVTVGACLTILNSSKNPLYFAFRPSEPTPKSLFVLKFLLKDKPPVGLHKFPLTQNFNLLLYL